MKFITALLLCFGAFALEAQTSVISLKSQHGNSIDLRTMEDKFGLMIPPPTYDTLIRISGDCVIQIGTDYNRDLSNGKRFRDTICDHWYYQEVEFDKKTIQRYHGNSVVLIGFEKTTNYRNENSPFFKKRTTKQSSKWLVVILLLTGFGAYLIHPKLFFKSES